MTDRHDYSHLLTNTTLTKKRMYIFLLLFASFEISRGHCLYGSTPDCAFQCHCSVYAECGGVCTSGCDSTPGDLGTPWRGETCQIGNVAQGKHANQTGQHSVFAAGWAVDGKAQANPSVTNCAHPLTRVNQYTEWWVDLGGRYKVYNVTIYNRNDCTDDCAKRLSYFTIGVIPNDGPEVECARFDHVLPIGDSVTLTCSTPLIGRVVHFARYGGVQKNYVTLCEVIVIGHLFVECTHCPHGEACNDVTGCERCLGAYQPDCKHVCDTNYYGINCMERCGHCTKGTYCDKRSGFCPSCEMWWVGEKCNTEVVYPELVREATLQTETTEATILVSWKPLVSVHSALNPYYQYTVMYKANQTSGEVDTGSVVVPHQGLPSTLYAHLCGLRPNTTYGITVVIQRVMRGVAESIPNAVYGPFEAVTNDVPVFAKNYSAPPPEERNVSKSVPKSPPISVPQTRPRSSQGLVPGTVVLAVLLVISVVIIAVLVIKVRRTKKGHAQSTTTGTGVVYSAQPSVQNTYHVTGSVAASSGGSPKDQCLNPFAPTSDFTESQYSNITVQDTQYMTKDTEAVSLI